MNVLKEGLLVTAFSMAVVFTVLIVISFIISLETFIISKLSSGKKKEGLNVNTAEVTEKQEDDLEIIAAITAALSMYTNLPEKQLRIKSIVRAKDSLSWRKA